MTTLTIVHVMRHGEVENPHGILYGRLPGFHLSELGKEMARTTAKHLFDTGIILERIVASPLERAQESAAPAAEIFDLEIHTDPLLIEAENKFEGQVVHGKRNELYSPRSWPRFLNPLKPSWGEPYEHQAQRMVQAVKNALNSPIERPDRIVQGPNNQLVREILLVSHQLPIWCLRLFIEGRPYAHLPHQRECSLASLTSLAFIDKTLVSWEYEEPAAPLLDYAVDMTPGKSSAAVNYGFAQLED